MRRTRAASGETYSPMDHLASAIAPGGSDGILMGMFAAYFDDSGTHSDSSVAVAACYVSTAEQWKLLERDWDAVKKIYPFDVFHMSDAVTGHGEFKGWPSKERRDLILKLIGLVQVRVRVGSVIAVPKADYDECIAERLRQKVGRYHYSFAVRSCLIDVARWRRHYEPGVPVQYVFDRHNRGAKGEIMAILEGYAHPDDADPLGLEVGGYSFSGKENIVPLQAVDMLAHEAFRHALNCAIPFARRRHSQVGDYMPELGRGTLRTGFWDRKTLTEFASGLSRKFEEVGWDASPDF